MSIQKGLHKEQGRGLQGGDRHNTGCPGNTVVDLCNEKQSSL